MIQLRPALWGVFRYEFLMQIRRLALWGTFLLILALFFFLVGKGPSAISDELQASLKHYPLLTVIGYWALELNAYLPIAVGVLLADRLARDKRTKVDELLNTYASPLWVRLAGKYAGSVCATLIPMFLFYMIGIIQALVLTKNIAVIPMSLAAFAAIVLPGVLFVGAFSIAVPAILWVPVYQVCFIGYWFWGNMFDRETSFPTLSRTILTPRGMYSAQGLFGLQIGTITSSPLLAFSSISLLIGMAFAALIAIWRYLLRNASR